MWNVDLKLFHCYQSCHDPECRALQFTGKPVPLPKAVRDAVDDALFEWHLANVDESSLYASCREVVSPNTTMVHLQSEVSTLSLASQPSVTPDSQEASLEAHKKAPADSSRLPRRSKRKTLLEDIYLLTAITLSRNCNKAFKPMSKVARTSLSVDFWSGAFRITYRLHRS